MKGTDYPSFEQTLPKNEDRSVCFTSLERSRLIILRPSNIIPSLFRQTLKLHCTQI